MTRPYQWGHSWGCSCAGGRSLCPLSLGCSCWSRQSLGARRGCRAAWPCVAPTSAYSREDVHGGGLNKPINKPISPRSGHFSVYCLNCLAWVLYCLRPAFGVGWECWDVHNPTVWAFVFMPCGQNFALLRAMAHRMWRTWFSICSAQVPVNQLMPSRYID